MTNTYTWTTPRGAKVEATITVNHITTEHRDLDGIGYEAKCNYWRRTVDTMTINGQPTKMKELGYYAGKCVISVDRIKRGKVYDTVMVAVPADVEESIYSEERAYIARKNAANEKAEAEYQKNRRSVLKAMDDDAEPYR